MSLPFTPRAAESDLMVMGSSIWTAPFPRYAPPIVIIVGTLAIAGLVIFKHDGNLQRLVDGTEPRFSFSKKKEAE